MSQPFDQSPILVTGAGGFIGRHLVAALRNQGHAVRALAHQDRDARELGAMGAEPVVGDLLDATVVARAVSGVRRVFHLAGRLYVAGSDDRDYFALHVDATSRLFAAAASRGLDYFVSCSTTGVHGPTTDRPAREDDPGQPLNAYERSKADGEAALRALARRLGAPLVIARPGLVYGPGDRHLAGWFRTIQRGYYRVIGSGANHLHPIYIDDAIRGMLACAKHASPEGRAFHIVGTRPVTMRELSEAIGRAVGTPLARRHLPAAAAYAAGALCELLPVSRQKLPLTRSRVQFMLQNRAYDGSRAREELGFVPEVELADGLAQTVAWYRANGYL